MSEITQIITEYTDDLPNKESMTPDEFDVAAEAWVEYQDGLAPELNTFASQANVMAGDFNDISDSAAVAIAAANFKGAWSSLSGTLDVPACVYHSNQYWILLKNLADVTASEPTSSNNDWALYPPLPVRVINKTANYSITSAEAAAGNIIFINYGATGEIEFQLPAPLTNARVNFIVMGGQYLKIIAPSDKRIWWKESKFTTTDGYVRANTSRARIELVVIAGNYMVTLIQGTWKVDE